MFTPAGTIHAYQPFAERLGSLLRRLIGDFPANVFHHRTKIHTPFLNYILHLVDGK